MKGIMKKQIFWIATLSVAISVFPARAAGLDEVEKSLHQQIKTLESARKKSAKVRDKATAKSADLLSKVLSGHFEELKTKPLLIQKIVKVTALTCLMDSSVETEEIVSMYRRRAEALFETAEAGLDAREKQCLKKAFSEIKRASEKGNG